MKYEYGVEYDTNGKEPNLPDGVGYQIMNDSSYKEMWSEIRRGTERTRWDNVTRFRIVDERYKPKEEDNTWFERGELPPVGDVIELAEETEFLSLVSGRITLIAKGAHCHVVGHAKRPDNNAECITLMPVVNLGAGFCTGNHQFLAKPIRTEREKAIEAAFSCLKNAGFDSDSTNTDYFDALYDAGLLCLPEQK